MPVEPWNIYCTHIQDVMNKNQYKYLEIEVLRVPISLNNYDDNKVVIITTKVYFICAPLGFRLDVIRVQMDLTAEVESNHHIYIM